MMNETDTNRSHGQTDEQIHFVLHNALHKLAPLTMVIGDIVLTNRKFCFLLYHDFPYAGSLGKGAGFLIGGIAGGLAAAISDGDKIINARNEAEEFRSEVYGFPLSERLALCPNSFTYPLDGIERFQVPGETEVSLVLRDGKHLDFVVPPISTEHQEAMNNWPDSAGSYNGADDPDGFLVGSASPLTLLERIKSGDLNAKAEVFKLGQSERYAGTLYAILLAMKKKERQSLYRELAEGPKEFRESMIAAAKKDIAVGKGNIFTGLLGFLACGVSVYFAFRYEAPFILIIIAVLFSVGGILAAVGAKRRKRANDAIISLKSD